MLTSWASSTTTQSNGGARALIRTEPQNRQVTITVTGPTKSRQQLAGLCQAPADGTARPKNLRRAAVGAGPRAAYPRQLTPLSVHPAAVDGAGTVHAAAPCRDRSSDISGPPSNTASVEPLVDMLCCKNWIANAAARTAVRIL